MWIDGSMLIIAVKNSQLRDVNFQSYAFTVAYRYYKSFNKTLMDRFIILTRNYPHP